MEVHFSPLAERQRLPLLEAPSQDSAGTLSAIISTICDVVFETTCLPYGSLIASLNALAPQRTLFRDVLSGIQFDGNFTKKEQHIIEGASKGYYAEDDIEGAFYKHGGNRGVIAIVLFFRKSGTIFRCWKTIHPCFRPWLVNCAVSAVTQDILDNFPDCANSTAIAHSSPPASYKLQYLGPHAGRREASASQKLGLLPTELPSPQPRSIPNGLVTRLAGQPASNASSSKQEQYDANTILALLCSLGSPVSRDVLFLGLVPQKRWDKNGNILEITPQNGGLIRPISSLFSSRKKLDQTITYCIRNEFIVQWVPSSGSLSYSISQKSAEQIQSFGSRESMCLIHLEYIAYIYPRSLKFDSQFRDKRKALLPYLESAWDLMSRASHIKIPSSVLTSLVEASLAAYTLLDLSHKETCMRMISRVQDDELPFHVQLAVVVQKSITLRSQGDHDQSDHVIKEALELERYPIHYKDTRLYCTFGRLLLSQAENAILRKDFKGAAICLSRWEPLSLSSELQIDVTRLQQAVISRVDRYDGDFPAAEKGLETCLEYSQKEASRYHILHHLGDVYCERELPNKAIDLILPEVAQLRAQGKEQSKAFRRISLPLAEAYLRLGMWGIDADTMFAKSWAVLQEILNVFDRMNGHDISDQLNHVRSVIAIARIYWYQHQQAPARSALQDALRLTQGYRTFSDGNYYIGFIRLFLATVEFKLHLYDEGNTSLALANTILCQAKPRHFMPGLGTYVLASLLQSSSIPQWPWSPITQHQLQQASQASTVRAVYPKIT